MEEALPCERKNKTKQIVCEQNIYIDFHFNTRISRPANNRYVTDLSDILLNNEYQLTISFSEQKRAHTSPVQKEGGKKALISVSLINGQLPIADPADPVY